MQDHEHQDEEPYGEQARQLAQVMADAALTMQAETDREHTLGTMLRSAVDTVPGADFAGITLVRGDNVTPDVITNEIADRMDTVQAELGEGPCLTSLREEHIVRVDDLAADERWPRFAPRAVELGVRSVLSFQLFVHGNSLGALNLYAREAHAFDTESYLVGHLFAQHASVAYAEARDRFHQGEALVNRDLIGQAKGILMQRDGISAHAAFSTLAEASQHANMKLVEVARWLTEQAQTGRSGPASRSPADNAERP